MSSDGVRFAPASLAPPAIVVVLMASACASQKPASAAGARAEGERVYARLCVNCHRAEGRGTVGEVPPLTSHFPEVLNAGGREYLIRAVLYGLEGPIHAGGRDYQGLMVPMAYMKDDELAAVLNLVATSWGNAEQLPRDFVAFTASEIAAQRGARLRPREVRAQRPASLDRADATKGNP